MSSLVGERARRAACAVMASLVAVAGGTLGVSAEQLPSAGVTFGVPPPPDAGAVYGSAPFTKTGTAICTTQPSSAANLNTDCEPTAEHAETSIAVDPTNPDHLLGGVYDSQVALNPGGQVSYTQLARAHVSFDGGRSWSEYPVDSTFTYSRLGDPAVAFDADGHAYYAMTGWRSTAFTSTSPDIVVASSADGGRGWDLKRVADGSGTAFESSGVILDKPYITAWGHGNAIVTYGGFWTGARASLSACRIYAAATHDYGASWSPSPEGIAKPNRISAGLPCAWGSTPAVTTDGRVYVSFLNVNQVFPYRDEYWVVELDASTGARVAGPIDVGLVYDGVNDAPYSALGRHSYHDSQFQTSSMGDLAADPTDPTHLAVVWSDMRNSSLPALADPYSAATNSDVVVSQSYDRGHTWSAPSAIALANDQWMPWGEFDGSGRLRVGMYDRSADPANDVYMYSIATELAPGTLSFTVSPVSTVASDPTKGDRWAATVNPAFPHSTFWLGDYSNIAIVPGTTHVAAYWTDMRETACWAFRCGHGEDAYFAEVS